MSEVNLYTNYCDELDERKIKISEERWRNVLLFRKHVLQQQQGNENTILHALRKLSGSFFRYEKQRSISRPNFIICLKENKYKINSSSATSVYNSFDILQKNEFDWRMFIFMLFVTFRSVHENAKNLLKFAFKFYTGEFEDIHTPCNSRIKLQHLNILLEMLIRPDRIHTIVQSFDDEWGKLSTRRDPLKTSSVENSISSHITYGKYSIMLDRLALFHNENQLDTFEREYYPLSLYRHRRCLRYMSHFIMINTTKIKADVLHEWKAVSTYRRRIRFLCNSITRRTSILKLSNSIKFLWKNTIMHLAVIGIQCAFRAFLARKQLHEKQTINSSATTMQKMVRGFLARQDFLHMNEKRMNSVVIIQRSIRAALGRHLAHNKLMTLLDIKQLQRVKEEEIRRHNQTILCTVNIQRRFRDKLSLRNFNQAVEKKRRELIVAAEMESMILEEEKEKRIHNKQTQVYAKDAFNELKEKNMIEQKAAIDRDKVQKMHIRLMDRCKVEQETERKRQQVKHIDQMREKLKNEWKLKKEQESEAFMKYFLLCLNAPEISSERKKGKEFKKKIKRRLSDVLLRATSRGIKMETDEAKVIAEKEVMNTYIDELKVNLHREMEQACDDLEMKLKTEFTEEEDRIEKEKIASARMVLVCSVRRWLAKKELRQRCLKTFEKLFDERYKAYYYRNVKTGEVSWNKPKALGHLDLQSKTKIESIFSVE